MSIGAMMFISLLAWASIIVYGYLYLLCIWAKNWMDRKPMPSLESIRFAKWLHKTLSGEEESTRHCPDYAAELVAGGFVIFVALSLVALSINYLLIRLIVGSIVIAVGSMYTVRWMWDVKKSVYKIKESTHLYNKEEK